MAKIMKKISFKIKETLEGTEKYHFDILSHNGNLLCWGYGYNDVKNVMKTIKSIIKHIKEDKFEIIKEG